VAPSVRNGLLLRCHPLWLITANPTNPKHRHYTFSLFLMLRDDCKTRRERRGGEGKRRGGGHVGA
jgi:hypothetical protein